MRRICTGHGVTQWVASRTNEHGNFGAAEGIGIQELRPSQNAGFPPHWEIIAGVVFNEWNGVNINMHVASDGSSRWLTREFLRVVFDYPFNKAKVHRVTGLVGEGNMEARKFDEHIGFKLEARLAGAHPTGDLLIYVMRRDDCRFLREPYAKQSIRSDLLRAAA